MGSVIPEEINYNMHYDDVRGGRGGGGVVGGGGGLLSLETKNTKSRKSDTRFD